MSSSSVGKMLSNVLLNEFILVLWKRRGRWLLGGGCAGVNGRLVKPVEMAAPRLTSLCPDSKCSVGSGCGNAPAPLPARPGMDAQAVGRSWGQAA